MWCYRVVRRRRKNAVTYEFREVLHRNGEVVKVRGQAAEILGYSPVDLEDALHDQVEALCLPVLEKDAAGKWAEYPSRLSKA
jgi:hypothetical protein